MAFQLIAASLADIGLATAAAQSTQIGQLSSSPAATIAQDVANTGTPLLHGFDFIQPINTVVPVPANSSAFTGGNFLKPGYVVGISATIASAAATCPFLLVSMTWRDSTNTVELAKESWYLPAASSGLYMHVGKGPVKGAHLEMKLVNLDPAFAMSVTLNLLETTAHIARDDWRATDYQTASVPGYGAYVATGTGLAFGTMTGGVLAVQDNDTLPANTTWKFLLPLYCGQVFWQFNANAAITVSLRTPTAFNVASGNALDGDAPMWFNTALTDVTVELAHPRFPLYLTMSNSTASGIPLGWLGVIVENCS